MSRNKVTMNFRNQTSIMLNANACIEWGDRGRRMENMLHNWSVTSASDAPFIRNIFTFTKHFHLSALLIMFL